jgi:hypothetical protein
MTRPGVSTLNESASKLSPAPSALAPAAPFQPFFTLVHDADTDETHHPRRVHYIFSDDEASAALSTACADALASSRGGDGSNASSGDGTSGSGADHDSARVLLVDVDAAGTRVLRAHALTPAWQVVDAVLAAAPTWEAGGGAARDERQGMMLRIEGVAAERRQAGPVAQGALGVGEIDVLMAAYRACQASLGRVVGREGAEERSHLPRSSA